MSVREGEEKDMLTYKESNYGNVHVDETETTLSGRGTVRKLPGT